MAISDIDFVLPWVDGNDPDWLSQFSRYATGVEGDKRKSRYRDWDNLQYLFRGFEQFTPWVRKIHFVTCGHVPSWLDLNHEKLNVVKHEDFIDEEHLPIFSCNPIEVNLHRIPGLSEKFVYFNDDCFISKTVGVDRFFENGLPKDIFAFNTIVQSPISHIKINDVQAINRHFNKHEVVQKNFLKLFNYRYSSLEMFKTMLLMPWPFMTGFFDPHQPQPYLKKTFTEVWEHEPEILQATSRSVVRCSQDVNQYLFRYWRLCKGEFSPIGFGNTFSKIIHSVADAELVCRKLLSRKCQLISINDDLQDEQSFFKVQEMVNSALMEILPHKSSFEL